MSHDMEKARIVAGLFAATPETAAPLVGGYTLEEFSRSQLVIIARYLASRSQAVLLGKLAAAYKKASAKAPTQVDAAPATD